MSMPTTPPPTSPPVEAAPSATLDLSHSELVPVLESLAARKEAAQKEVDAAKQELAELEQLLSGLTTNHALLQSRMDSLGGGTLSLTVI